MRRTWLITGCSTGLGRAMAEAVIAADDCVAITARRAEDIADLHSSCPDRTLALELDITSESQVTQALAAVVQRFGRLDVLVNNAGCGLAAAWEEADAAEIRHVYETNVFGTMNATRHAIPLFRRQGSGHIVFVSSIGAVVGLPGTGVYGSSKAAVDAIAEVLYHELAPFGIKVSSLLPGVFKTDFRNKSLRWTTNAIDDYDWCRPKYQDAEQRYPASAASPDLAGKALLALVGDPNPPLRLPLGADAVQALRNKLALLERDLIEHGEASARFGSQDASLLVSEDGRSDAPLGNE